ncbi:hypothetical protein [Ravibacter arvi]|uniref:hypothetical protein n=1 Tax=Ravibacter arvi TaxID=2051041 RepID=UPI0031E848EB
MSCFRLSLTSPRAKKKERYPNRSTEVSQLLVGRLTYILWKCYFNSVSHLFFGTNSKIARLNNSNKCLDSFENIFFRKTLTIKRSPVSAGFAARSGAPEQAYCRLFPGFSLPILAGMF